jgi:hypothetical protein
MVVGPRVLARREDEYGWHRDAQAHEATSQLLLQVVSRPLLGRNLGERVFP